MRWDLPPALPLEVLEAGTTLARIHRTASIEPFFGPAAGRPPSRFDDPERAFRVCYLGLDATASFAETFLRRPGLRIVTRSELDARRLSNFRLARTIRLAKLSGEGLSQCGCTAAVTSGADYEEPRAVARAVWAHVDGVDGIYYRCRHDNDLAAVALFDRAASAIALIGTEPLLVDQRRLLGWLGRYDLALA